MMPQGAKQMYLKLSSFQEGEFQILSTSLFRHLCFVTSLIRVGNVGYCFLSEFFAIDQCLHDAFGGASVPAVGQGGVLPVAVQQLVEGGSQCKRVFAHQLVGADAPCFGVFGVRVQRDAGHVEEGGFFGDVARVGDDAFGLVDEEAEVQVALGRQDVQVGGGQVECLDGLLHVGVQRSHDGHAVGFLDDGLQQRLYDGFLSSRSWRLSVSSR